jgi:hypothetical protein
MQASANEPAELGGDVELHEVAFGQAGASDGMPCTISSLTLMHVEPGEL